MSYAPAVWTLDSIDEEAYIGACELVGPNSCEFDSVKEHLVDAMCIKYGVAQE